MLLTLTWLLQRWRAQFEKMFPSDQWTGPDPSPCSLHRLGGGGALISDTCNDARLSRELLGEMVASHNMKQHLGDQNWEAVCEAEDEQATRTHDVDCWQHIRKTFLAEMSRAQSLHIQDPR